MKSTHADELFSSEVLSIEEEFQHSNHRSHYSKSDGHSSRCRATTVSIKIQEYSSYYDTKCSPNFIAVNNKLGGGHLLIGISVLALVVIVVVMVVALAIIRFTEAVSRRLFPTQQHVKCRILAEGMVE